MKVNVKPGVIISELNSKLCHVCYSVWFVFKEYGLTPTITSANDSTHLPNSLHYQNLAWDFRIWGLTDPKKVRDELDCMLNIKHRDYDVLYEGDHIHVEYNPHEIKERET